ncbi:MAG: DNA/RNA nuclease SfsA [Candidatus Thiodiazotropha sp. (ex Ctena orbiculata)]|uniref:Sugar fermentation stimulation protein homolog n=1 Tax=Candidatus Thiodiazotropha taylori TaxID=2792791 RepID=A0A944QTB4_9GAMM|nr:DNA/RNA nuclease SfsA [Candidatus Thiodiazotropha taylori]MBV2137995.1 DNA/RNA nuclease SfsA [Candidatus Thiodiazotropha taylori]PVV06533.1 MAG: sugar fermentation stimulation protein SfsA [gamma proteobacterium symbiont of Ctena orbiculata]
MQLPPLTNGQILRRYKRFLTDIELPGGEVVTAHCPNTGSMLGCWQPGAPVQLSHSDNPRRKLAWTLERVDMGQGWIGVHTGRTNPVVEEAVKEGRIEDLVGYRSIRREVVYTHDGEKSRFDLFLAEGRRADAWVEVKNVTLWQGNGLSFPDAVTQRGRKHLELLAAACRQGYRGVMVYALNRPEGDHFHPADEIDPAYAETLRRVVREAGVEVIALRIAHGESTMEVEAAVEVVLD